MLVRRSLIDLAVLVRHRRSGDLIAGPSFSDGASLNATHVSFSEFIPHFPFVRGPWFHYLLTPIKAHGMFSLFVLESRSANTVRQLSSAEGGYRLRHQRLPRRETQDNARKKLVSNIRGEIMKIIGRRRASGVGAANQSPTL